MRAKEEARTPPVVDVEVRDGGKKHHGWAVMWLHVV
jgi:hypothetical protein